jgi:hypothetical protein
MGICWAYDKQMRRCTLEAGHSEDHAIYITWTDNECFSPDQPVHVPVHNQESVGMEYDPQPLPPAKTVEACVACQHKHIGGECKCGCYAHI